VLWIMSRIAPNAIWYSYLIAYIIEAVLIFILHKANHIEFRLKQES